MVRLGLRIWAIVGCVAFTLGVRPQRSEAISLDKEGDIKFGLRTYVNARVGTENTHDGVPIPARKPIVSTSGTFPHSAAGHLRQNRAYIEAEINHDVSRLLKEGVGPLGLFNDLPFTFKNLAYHFTFRGEGEGLYDWGPQEYSTARELKKVAVASPTVALDQTVVDVAGSRRRLRKLGVDRERLFQAYVEANVGNLFTRVGRQILSWGETDGFQLLDHINPLDSSFGGFLISLDERRVPLDMVRTNYYLGDLGPFSEAYVESFVAIDNKVGYSPGAPAGSPWTLPGFGASGNVTETTAVSPARTINNARGGVQLRFNALDATFGLAHYYTYFDLPALQVSTLTASVARSFNDGLPCSDPSRGNVCGFPTHALLSAPKVQVSGATTTFALPQFYSVARAELAYFKDEPAFTQGQADPFIFNAQHRTTGGRRLRDSINGVVGLDANRWIRFLNPNQTFLISTQFFYKHIKNSAGTKVFAADGTPNPDREVLPVPLNVLSFGIRTLSQPLEPVFISQPRDQFLQTLFIGTSYRSGMINPGLTVFYDWGGGFVYQPSVTFVRDPFRFVMDYSVLDSHIYKGGSGVSLLKDRDNVQFRVEYVL